MAGKKSTKRGISDNPLTTRVSLRDKVDHVRKAKNTGNHHCHWPGCSVMCKPAMWGCKKHWYMLPHELRTRIWRAYEIGQEKSKTPSPEYVEAARDVQKWIKKHYPEGGEHAPR